MGTLAPLEELKTELHRRMADAAIRVDAPSSPEGSWWIDVERQGNVASVEWRAAAGFGVAGPDGGYGEGPDVVVHDAASAADHVARLLERRLAPNIQHVQELVGEFQQQLEAMVAEINDVFHHIETSYAKSVGRELRLRIRAVVDDARQVESKFEDMAKLILADPQRTRHTRTEQ